MTELQLARGATTWLRRIGFGMLAFLVSVGLTLWAFNAANSNSDPGWNSEQDFYLEVNAGSVDRNQFAQHPDNGFMNGQANGTWEAWIFPTSHSLNRQGIFNKEGHTVLGLDSGRLWTALWPRNTYIDRITRVTPPQNL